MEVQQHQEVDVVEVTSKVYDISYPTPVSLKQLSAMVISLEIWRCKVNEYRTSRKLREFNPYRLREENTWVKTLLPDLPSTIYKTIEQVVSKFEQSFRFWRTQHYEIVGFCHKNSHANDVLNYFDDFVCDYDGSIDYSRTAERMMRCEGFNSEMKFIIASMYFFEDDIRRIWPSVSRNMNVDFINFHSSPQLYYWICHLTNQLDKIATHCIETMFRTRMHHNRPSVEFFWNCKSVPQPLDYQIGEALRYIDVCDFVRFILPKLDDEQIDKYINDGYGDRLYTMFLDLHCDERFVLRTWLHVRNIIKKSNFTNLIVRMLPVMDDEDRYYHDQEKWEYLCCQIWKHTPTNLKPSERGFNYACTCYP